MTAVEIDEGKVYSNPYFFCCDAWNKLFADDQDENRYLRVVICFNSDCEAKVGSLIYLYPFLMRIGPKQMSIAEFYAESGFIPLFRLNIKHGVTFKMNISSKIETLSGDFQGKITEAMQFVQPFNKKWVGEPLEFSKELKQRVKDMLERLIISYEEKGDFIVVQSENAIITCYDPLLIPFEYSKLRPIFPEVLLFMKGSKTKISNDTIVSLGYFSNNRNAHDHLAVIIDGHINDWMDICIKH